MEFREAILAVRPDADVNLLGRAYDVAAHCHQGQKRRSGDPYITHPAAVARILAGLGAVDDQLLCAAILHDTVEDTPYTMPELRRDFGSRVAAMVAGHMALDHLGRLQRHKATQTLAAIGSADIRVVTMKVADRLHNMRTLQFLPQAKQLRRAREVLDIFLPVAGQLSLPAVQSELQALACAALIRNRPAGPPRRRVIAGLDIEQSTSRPDPVKAALKAAPGPLLLVVSSPIHDVLAGHEAFRPLVTTQIAGREHRGWSPALALPPLSSPPSPYPVPVPPCSRPTLAAESPLATSPCPTGPMSPASHISAPLVTTSGPH
jgi:hypothetical protein